MRTVRSSREGMAAFEWNGYWGWWWLRSPWSCVTQWEEHDNWNYFICIYLLCTTENHIIKSIFGSKVHTIIFDIYMYILRRFFLFICTVSEPYLPAFSSLQHWVQKRKREVNFLARSIMFSWSCSLSSCDLSHIELMGSCHNYTTLLDMKAGHCISPPLSLSRTQPPIFFFQMLTAQLQTLCDKLRTLQKSKACGGSDQLIVAKQFFLCG